MKQLTEVSDEKYGGCRNALFEVAFNAGDEKVCTAFFSDEYEEPEKWLSTSYGRSFFELNAERQQRRKEEKSDSDLRMSVDLTELEQELNDILTEDEETANPQKSEDLGVSRPADADIREFQTFLLKTLEQERQRREAGEKFTLSGGIQWAYLNLQSKYSGRFKKYPPEWLGKYFVRTCTDILRKSIESGTALPDKDPSEP